MDTRAPAGPGVAGPAPLWSAQSGCLDTTGYGLPPNRAWDAALNAPAR
jgi:hypothetical protein